MDALKLMPLGSRIGPLPPLGGAAPAAKAGGPEAAGAESGPTFAQVLQNTLSQVAQLQTTADQAAQQVATGQAQDLHTAMIAAEKATLALDLTVQFRNKVLEAYQEIMRLPV